MEMPEIDVTIQNALEEYASMCLCSCSYEFAFRKGTISPSMLAKIAKKAADYSKCHAKLRLEPGLNVAYNQAVVLEPLYLMLTWGNMAKSELAAEKYGNASAYAMLSLREEERLRQTLQSIPAPALSDLIEREVPSVAEAMKTIRHDNDNVYFGEVPKEATLPTLHGVVLKAPENYQPPDPPAFTAAELLPGLDELTSGFGK